MGTGKDVVITINRQFCSGGRSLASILSERLSIPYYDRDFVKKTVEESGIDEADVEREGEELSKSSKVLDSLLKGTVPYSSSHDRIFDAEKKVILELAKKPCIIIGRCADYVLKEAGVDILSIYLHASAEKRIERATELYTDEETDLAKYVETRDRQRRAFYKQYTGSEIFDAERYTITFDTGRLSFSECADAVICLLQNNG